MAPVWHRSSRIGYEIQRNAIAREILPSNVAYMIVSSRTQLFMALDINECHSAQFSDQKDVLLMQILDQFVQSKGTMATLGAFIDALKHTGLIGLSDILEGKIAAYMNCSMYELRFAEISNGLHTPLRNENVPGRASVARRSSRSSVTSVQESTNGTRQDISSEMFVGTGTHSECFHMEELAGPGKPVVSENQSLMPQSMDQEPEPASCNFSTFPITNLITFDHIVLFGILVLLAYSGVITYQLYRHHRIEEIVNTRTTNTAELTQHVNVKDLDCDYNSEGAKMPSNNNLYIFGQENEVKRVIQRENLRFMEQIVWHGCIETKFLFEILRYASGIIYIELQYNCADNTVKRKRLNGQIPNEVTPVSLVNLSHLTLDGFSGSHGIIGVLRKGIVMGKLTTLRIAETALNVDDSEHIMELLINNISLETIVFERIKWDVWILNKDLPVFKNLHYLKLDYVNSQVTRHLLIGSEFCRTFPALKSFNMTSDLPFSEILKIIQCKTITHLSVTLFVPASMTSVNMDFLHRSAAFQKFSVYFEFENNAFGDCEVLGVQNARNLFSFPIKVQSNCRSIT